MDTTADLSAYNNSDSAVIRATDEVHQIRRGPRLTVFVAHESPNVCANWVEELRGLTDCEVKFWRSNTCQSATEDEAGKEWPFAGLSQTLRVLDAVIREPRPGLITAPTFVVLAPSAEESRTTERVRPGSHHRLRSTSLRGGLAPSVRRRICELMDREFGRAWSLFDLAAIANLSENHFGRAFKQSLGIPPHQYLLERRVAAAAEMIKKADRCLSDIALEVGFSDQSHFTRLFVRQMGETPRQFRWRHR